METGFYRDIVKESTDIATVIDSEVTITYASPSVRGTLGYEPEELIGKLDEGGFYVEDTGSGIPQGDREAVFEPGHTSAADGTGFGLTIVRRIAEAHGWGVEITPETEGGARFEFTGVEID